MKRIAALLLSLCLLALCGCSRKPQAAILCINEAEAASQAMCEQHPSLIYTVAGSDRAAIQQLDSDAGQFALVTRRGMEDALAGTNGYIEKTTAKRVCDVVLSAFYILSTDGEVNDWSKSTRVVIVGDKDGFGDQLAQQVLSCALYGTVRYMDTNEALTALREKKADAVMGMMYISDPAFEKAMKKIKGVTLEMLPAGLVSVKLPDDSMVEYTLAIGQSSMSTYAVMGTLACAPSMSEDEISEAYKAAEQAGIVETN